MRCIIVTICIGIMFILTGCSHGNRLQKRDRDKPQEEDRESYAVYPTFSHTNPQVTFDVMLSQLISTFRDDDRRIVEVDWDGIIGISRQTSTVKEYDRSVIEIEWDGVHDVSQRTSKVKDDDKSLTIILSCDKEVLKKKKIPYKSNHVNAIVDFDYPPFYSTDTAILTHHVNAIADLVYFAYWYDLVLCLDGNRLILLDHTSILPLLTIRFLQYHHAYKVDGLDCTKVFWLSEAIDYLKSNDIDEVALEYPLTAKGGIYDRNIINVARALIQIRQTDLRVYFKYNPELSLSNDRFLLDGTEDCKCSTCMKSN